MEPPLASNPRFDWAAAAGEEPFSRVLVPIDFGPGSQRALATALALQRAHGSEVHLFHLAEPGENEQFLAGVGGAAPQPGQGLLEDAEARLLRFVENVFPGRSTDVIVHARRGVDLVEQVRQAAGAVEATMVLLGARPKHTMLRAPVEKIVRELDATVMIVWAPEEAAR